MIGTILNSAGIVVGGLVGLRRKKPLSAANESFFKVMLGAFAVFYGLRLTWLSLNGPFLHVAKQILVAILSLMLGKLTGRLLRLQTLSNRLGRSARDTLSAAKPGQSQPWTVGFQTCTALFCAAPLGLIGALQDGISSYSYPLGVKAVMDGLASMAFAQIFGWGVVVAALPVLALQGTLTLASELFLKPVLTAHGWLDSVNAVGGLLVFCVALVILGIKKIELADYLPSLAFAPLLTWISG
jgi:uncharacterized membrane protein YqgA involved in biofilm formation